MDYSNYTPYIILGLTIFGIAFFVMISRSKEQTPIDSEETAFIVVSKNVSSKDVDELLKDEKLVVLDVRTKEEYDSGHLPKSINIDFHSSDFKERIAKLDKSKKYLVYCRSGNRSSQTIDIMKSQGFNDLLNLSGGINSVSANNICTGNC